MKQVLLIHGGESFSSYDAYLNFLKTMPLDYARLKPQNSWKSWIAEQMPEADVLMPRFPNSNNAVYGEWKIYFEKIVPFFGDDVRLVGNSLGAMFLAKYLHENPLARPVSQLILIAGQYGDRNGDENLGDFIVMTAKDLSLSAQSIHLFYSKDDPIVTYDSLVRFQTDLPTAVAHTFTDRGHFNVETFPELLEILQRD